MVDRAGQAVEFPSNGHSAEGYLALPGSGSGPGIVVVQEYWGLVDHIRDVCDRFAAEGFVALAPDLYHGETASEPDTAGKMMMELDIETAARDMGGALDFLLAHDAVTGQKVGTVGFCMGGGLALVLAARRSDQVGAAVSFYGVFAGDIPDLSSMSAPVLGHFGDEDENSPPEQTERLEQAIRQAGVEVTFDRYPGAGHAFYNETRPEAHDPHAADVAWARTLDFLRAALN